MTAKNTTVEIINWNLRVRSTLSKVSTSMQSVDKALTKIQIKMPKAMRVKGNMKLAI